MLYLITLSLPLNPADIDIELPTWKTYESNGNVTEDGKTLIRLINQLAEEL